MIPSDIRLYTWVDVEDVLTRALATTSWPDWLLDARVYWDALSIRVKPNQTDKAVSWLGETFEPRMNISDGDPVILLESHLSERKLPITIEETTEGVKFPRLQPSMARPSVLTSQLQAKLQPRSTDPEAPSIFAFHSFKGGVGRTLHAFALASLFAEKQIRVLLVDADFEAPGITWMLQTRLPSPPISFADYLAIAHSDASPHNGEATDLVAHRLQDAFLNGIYVLPAFRSVKTFQTLEIRPDNLLQGSPDDFLLTSMLYSLARKLNVQAVIVDLRAGLSELSAGLLLDPRVNRIIVTSTSAQSLSGTEVVLALLAEKSPSTLDEHPVPSVILNQVPPESGRSNLESIEERLISAVAHTVNRDGEDFLRTALKGPTLFDSALLALPPDWDDVVVTLARTSFAKTVESFVQGIPVREQSKPATFARSIDSDRKSLRDTAGRFIVAETSEGDDFLPIAPLRRLVEDHSSSLPNTVIVGAKGAGKTYTYLQILRRKHWKDFATDARASRESIDALLCPVLQPRNLISSAWLGQKALAINAELRLAAPLDHFGINDAVDDALTKTLHQGNWRDLWLDLLAWTLGFENQIEGAGRRLPEHLKSAKKRVLFLFDGLEDIFQNLSGNERQQIALRALLQDVPNWLDQNPDRSIGMLIFVRRDLVAAAVKQNSAQLMARYEPYALKWNSTEALRLVAWVASKAGVLPTLRIEEIPDLQQDELTEQLLPLWGRKLGSDRSREGRSAEWVLAALSDFRGQIQARDIVRLIKIAAATSVGATAWTDRLLVPQAIRDAVAECSTEKIREISEENVQLKRIFEQLRLVPDESRSIPFTSEQVGLDAQDLLLLETNGVLVSYEREYFMPEIFRRGLDFRLPQGARPRVLAVARQRQNDA
jgi:MinD-like ATPase involved in chromosome partitioning or flagellar assembly